MNSKILKICAICFTLLFISQTAFAQVYTSTDTETQNTGVYVAGNPDFYPIEYYNKETKQYEGVMPEILKAVSEQTGIDFTYIHSKNSSQKELAVNLQAELVSAYITDSNEAYAADNVTVFSYTFEGKTVNVGWAFTEIADGDLINTLKNEAAKITEQEINGYLVSSSHSKQQDKTGLTVIYILCALLFVMIIVLAWFGLRNVKKKMLENKMTDYETGIGNLVYFEHYFNNMISDLSRSLYYIAYITIDRDYLQIYHSESIFTDAVKYTAGVLASYAKQNEFAARISENSFAFAFQSTNEAEARQQVKEIIGKLVLYTEAEEKSSKPVFHTAVYNLNTMDRSCELLLYNLRKICNKLMGTDAQYVFCDTCMMNSAVEEKQLLESISSGFKNSEFKLYLQFIVDNKTKKIVSAEALSRWDSKEKGLLTPDKYIEAMEAAGMITTLDYHMFEMSCRQLHKWKDTEFDSLTLSCNFTRITLSEDDFIDKIDDIAKKYVFEKSRLIIEITEDTLEKNKENVLDNVLKCKEMGFKIALDDLGSGYTSLINLCEYPVDIVKIDRNIILNTDKKNGKRLFTGMIALSHSLNLKVVCEGVETEEQNAFVSASECDMVQGWYYSKVLPLREGEEFIRLYTEKQISLNSITGGE